MRKIILDICGGTGSWSKPYKDAGYDVKVITLPETDVNSYFISNENVCFPESGADVLNIPISKIYGILAAPPCTMFSLARTTAKEPRDLKRAMQLVIACLNIIWFVRQNHKLAFWAMENPKGLLRQFMGKPAFTFDASEFGEDYNKATDLWGYFNDPKKKRDYVRFASTDKNTRKLPAIPSDYIRDPAMSLQAIKRSITPQGFARAFFKANSVSQKKKKVWIDPEENVQSANHQGFNSAIDEIEERIRSLLGEKL